MFLEEINPALVVVALIALLMTLLAARMIRVPLRPKDDDAPAHQRSQGGARPAASPSERGRFEIREKLGAGAIAVVHRTYDRTLKRHVALKLLPEDIALTPSAMRGFEREALAISRLDHPNVVKVYDVGLYRGRPFISMELLEGKSVAEMIDVSDAVGLPLVEALRLGEQLMAALTYAHGEGVVHRDLKPGNMMTDADGNVKLLDFGVATILDREDPSGVTGTPSYMAPEQMAGQPVDARSDLFAAGVTLYEMVTGYLPYDGTDREMTPIPVQRLRPEAPNRLNGVIMACLQPDPAARPRDADRVRKTLRSIRRRLERSPTSPTPRETTDTQNAIRRPRRRNLSEETEAAETGKAALSDDVKQILEDYIQGE